MTATDPAARTLSAALEDRRTAALAQWEAVHADVEQQRAGTTLRELRIDLDRRLAALRRQRDVLDAAATRRHLPAALVAARDERSARRLVEALAAVGMEGAEPLDNGADAVGLAVVSQPEVVVVDAPLAMMSVRDVVADVRRYVPGAVVVACAEGVAAPELRAAGADAAFGRGAAPQDVAAELVALLSARQQVPAQG